MDARLSQTAGRREIGFDVTMAAETIRCAGGERGSAAAVLLRRVLCSLEQS